MALSPPEGFAHKPARPAALRAKLFRIWTGDRAYSFSSQDAFKWMRILLTVTVLWRITTYALGFPLWGDESRLMLNLAQRHTYSQLLLPLDNLQVAPPGFLAAQFTSMRHLGSSEWSLRLFPFVTSLAAVAVFVCLARLALSPIAAMCAVGLMGASHYITRYSLDIKPYGADLLASAALLTLAVGWMRRPDQLRWLVGLMLTAPLAIFFSFPPVFVGGAVSIGLLPSLWKRPPRCRRSAAAWLLFVLYNGALVGAFLLMLHVSGNGQYQANREGMLACWGAAMPPAQPLQFLRWLIDIHTAEMMAYPTGGKHGGSTLTFLLFLIGAYTLWKNGQRQLLLLFASTFALTFVAAALRRYPYGDSARVAQHLAVPICLLVGVALEMIISRCKAKRRAADITGAVFLAFTIGFLIRDVVHPYHTLNEPLVQRFFAQWGEHCTSDQGVWFASDFESSRTPVRWYLFRALGGKVERVTTVQPTSRVLALHREWWILVSDPDAQTQKRVRETLAFQGPQFYRVETRLQEFAKPGRLLRLELWRARGPTTTPASR